ncbi:MAG: hypothetical protein WCI05_13760 [Myxococcales bacterium]
MDRPSGECFALASAAPFAPTAPSASARPAPSASARAALSASARAALSASVAAVVPPPYREARTLVGGSESGWVDLPVATKGVSEVAVVSFAEDVFIDQLVLEDNGRRLLAEGAVLATVDGRGVVVERGKSFQARFHPPADSPLSPQSKPEPNARDRRVFAGRVYVRYQAFGHVLAPGRRPQAPPLSAVVMADRCPRGSVSDGQHGCVADEPLVDGSTRPVSLQVTCKAKDCAVFPWAGGKAPTDMASLEPLVQAGVASGKGGWLGHQGETATLTAVPGRFARVALGGCGSNVQDLYVEPLTAMGIDLWPAGCSTHCPTIGWLDPSRSLYTSPEEILRGVMGPTHKSTMIVFSGEVPAVNGVVELRLVEMQPETANIDQLVVDGGGALIAPDEGGAASVLAEVDGHALRLDENKQVHVRYTLPGVGTGRVSVRLLGSGYYERHAP